MAEVVDDDDLGAPDLRDYARTLWRHRRLVLLSMVVCVGAAVALSMTQSKVYQATADVIIQPSASSQSLDGSSPASDTARDVATATAVMQSQVVGDAAAKALGHVPAISIASETANSDVVGITAQSPTAAGAAKDANGYMQAYVGYARQKTLDNLARVAQQLQGSLTVIEAKIPTLRGRLLQAAQQQAALLQQQLSQVQLSQNLSALGGARILSVAAAPGSPISPKPIRNVAIVLFLGLLLGVGLAFLREYFDDKITSRADLEHAAQGLPLLGQIPRVEAWRKATNRLVTVDPRDSEEATAEAYRTLRTSIQFLGIGQSARTIQFTSAESGEGKTVTVANLAVAFARAGRQVAVVGCDLRRPRVHELFGLPNKVGFTSVLLGQMQPIDALQLVPGEPNLAVLSAGPAAPNPSELLGSSRAWEVISTLAEHADLVLVDSPPVLPVSDALVVSGMSDATILVTNVGTSTRRSIRRALELLRQVDAPLVGTVLNNGEPESASGYAPYSYAGTNGSSSSHNKPDTKRASAAHRSTR